MKNLLLFFLVSSFFLVSGCFGNYMTREEFEVFEAATTRRMNKLNYDLNITKGAINENRGAIEVLQEQLKEASTRLGNMNENIKKVDDIESNFNKKLNSMMKEVVKENERLVDEINKTREITVQSQPSSKDVNIYNKTPETNLETGYYHTVSSGESLSKIAHKYQVPIDSIIRANNIENPDSLYMGQKLFIPDPESK